MPGVRGDEPRIEGACRKHLTRRSGFFVFFILAKVLWFLLQPSSLMLAMVIAGATLAFTTWRRLARGFLWGAVAALLICGLSPLGDVLIRPLEQRFPRVEVDPPGSGLFTSKVFDNCRAMARIYGRRRMATVNTST